MCTVINCLLAVVLLHVAFPQTNFVQKRGERNECRFADVVLLNHTTNFNTSSFSTVRDPVPTNTRTSAAHSLKTNKFCTESSMRAHMDINAQTEQGRWHSLAPAVL